MFQESVESLGKAFGINHHSVSVFSESFVRSHLMFQMAKGLEFMVSEVRNALQLPPIVIVSMGADGQEKY